MISRAWAGLQTAPDGCQCRVWGCRAWPVHQEPASSAQSSREEQCAVDVFRIWKKYPWAMERALVEAGYGDAEFSVHRADGGAAGARWSWTRNAAELTGREWPDGLELAWNSATGWAYRGRSGAKLVALPVPVVAAPQAITALLPALMDGRRGQLPACEDRWEHAAAIVSWAREASVLDDDKYNAAYQRAEEEADDFSHWQIQMDSAETAAEPGTGETDTGHGTQGRTGPQPPEPD